MLLDSIRDEIREAAGVENHWKLTDQELGRYARAAFEAVEKHYGDEEKDKAQAFWGYMQEAMDDSAPPAEPMFPDGSPWVRINSDAVLAESEVLNVRWYGTKNSAP